MMKKRKLAYFLHDIAVGGAEIAFLSALPALHRTFDLKVFVLGDADPKLMEGIAEPIKRSIVCLTIPRWALIFHLPRIYRQLASFKPEIIISSLWRSAIPATLYKWVNGARINYVVLMHSSGFFHWADHFFTYRAIRVADVVLADAQATATFVLRLVGKQKTPVITLSYLTDMTPEQPTEYEYTGPKRFCYMGKLHPIKRVHLAVSAIGWLREQGVDATLAIFGRDEGAGAAIATEIKQLGLQRHVHVYPEIPPVDKERNYRYYPFYIQLSAQEGMAMSVAEAMQNGLVCVVTAVGEIPNYAKDGVSAILVDPTTSTSWRASLDKLLVVLKSEEMCRSISYAAHDVFKDTSIFSDSLIRAIIQYAK